MNRIICIALFVVAGTITQAQYNRSNLALDASSQKYQFQNLQLFPIRANKTFENRNKGVGNYATLKESLASKRISVKEKDHGNVNSLAIENTSTDTIMVLAGEVIQGGKQDRMIAEDVILYPNQKKTISVYCVEQGRWDAKSGDMSFKQYYNISSNEVRKAGLVGKNQQQVWNKVAEKTSGTNSQTSTGTLAALKESPRLANDLKKYADHFVKVIAEEPDVIGVVAVSGNKILGCDMFASHELFKKHYSNLVNSYATEAITSGGKVNIDYAKVNEYLDQILRDEKNQDREIEKKGGQLKNGDKKVHISTF
jgi:hypothetical protein